MRALPGFGVVFGCFHWYNPTSSKPPCFTTGKRDKKNIIHHAYRKVCRS